MGLAMPTTIEDLQNFYEFALEAINDDGSFESMQELVDQWNSQQERESVNEAIRRSHAEIAAGLGRPAEEFMAEMRAKYNLRSGD